MACAPWSSGFVRTLAPRWRRRPEAPTHEIAPACGTASTHENARWTRLPDEFFQFPAQLVQLIGFAKDRKLDVCRAGAIAGREQDRHARPLRTDGLGQMNAIHLARHHDIAEHGVDAVLFNLGQSGAGVGNPPYIVSKLLKQAGTGTRHLGIILDEKNGTASRGGLNVRP